jgi:hypothetical protein
MFFLHKLCNVFGIKNRAFAYLRFLKFHDSIVIIFKEKEKDFGKESHANGSHSSDVNRAFEMIWVLDRY